MSRTTEGPPSVDEIRLAAERIAPYACRTPCELSPHYSERFGVDVYLKRETRQETSSFKVRGALNKILSLDDGSRGRGLVAASTGNHGTAVSWAAARVDARAIVFAPESADAGKLSAIERLGAELRRIPGDPLEAELAARREAEMSGRTYVSPYNDRTVVAGQGTVGLEVVEQVPEVAAVLCAVGGGGLICGIATAVKAARPGARVVGVSPEASPVLMRSVEAGKIVELPAEPTLSDSTAGGVEPNAVTFELARELVDAWGTVSEEEIAAALRRHIAIEHELIEGAAAVPIAWAERDIERDAGPVVIVLCGANIGLDALRSALG